MIHTYSYQCRDADDFIFIAGLIRASGGKVIGRGRRKHTVRFSGAFGEFADPDCTACVRYAITGGPDHEPFTRGHRDHCSCDSCY